MPVTFNALNKFYFDKGKHTKKKEEKKTTDQITEIGTLCYTRLIYR